MKSFLIISILCFAGLQNVRGVKDLKDLYLLTSAGPHELFYKECGQELKLDTYLHKPKNIAILSGLTAFKSKKLMCIEACATRKQAELRGLTLHESYLEMINSFEKYGVHIPKNLHDELISRGEYCNAKERDECEYYMCLDPMKPPISHVIGLIFKPVLSEYFSSRFHKN